MMDFLFFLYVTYGLYIAGKIGKAPDNTDEVIPSLVMFLLVVLTWPAWIGKKD